ncbi:hypothetical protein H9W91_35795 (plasmid) [Streptomyces alfalfae]|uniref:hypothetical protein n=1 Tax=Streptomyces alfalfae TaxID=1642299 RepID=UPI001BADC9D6|nr:hypothetical protein [Streptomyces alfalfae]QUI36326.1 hypothetical protein H9W91_35795 [Streptomyces alfalfae]
MEAQTKAQRRALNQRAHFEQRQAERAARGPRGLAESWMERARAIAATREKGGDEDVWNDLSRTIATWVSRYEQ